MKSGQSGTVASGPLSARCADPAGDLDPSRSAELDLVDVALEAVSDGLYVRFEVQGTPAAAAAHRYSSSWQVLLTDGSNILYVISISSAGSDAGNAGWHASLSNFSGRGDHYSHPIGAPVGPLVDFTVPAGQLGALPESFTWWASAVSEDPAASDRSVADVCPDTVAAAIFDEGDDAFMPPVLRQATFPA